MARKQVEAGPIQKWDFDESDHARKVPYSVIGRFVQTRLIPSDYGDGRAPVVDLRIKGQLVTYGLKTMLGTLLNGVPANTVVEIEYLGMAPNAKGQSTHQFNVYELDGADAAGH